MPGTARIGDLSTGHDACPPVPITEGSSSVKVNGLAVATVGCALAPHGCDAHPSHSGVISGGAPTVFVEGKAVARSGDPVSCGGMIAGCSSDVATGNGRTVDETRAIAWAIVSDFLESLPNKAPEEEVIIATPAIAKAMAEKQSDEKDKQGWEYLSKELSLWLSRDAEILEMPLRQVTAEHEIFTVDADWFFSFDRANKEESEFFKAAGENTYLNDAAKASLVKLIKEKALNADGSSVYDAGGEFDFIGDGTVDPVRWNSDYYQYREVKRSTVLIDGLDAAMAGCQFRALAKGRVDKTAEGTKITITKIALFAYDVFQFNGESFFFDNLGWWSRALTDFSTTPVPPVPNNPYAEPVYLYYNLGNWSFNRFRNKYGKGGDFVVMSDLHDVEGLPETTFISD